MSRRSLVEIVRDSGWRLPFFVAHRLALPLLGARDAARRLRLQLLCHGKIGARVVIDSGLRITARAAITIGDDSHIGRDCTFEVRPAPGVVLEIGDKVWISERCLVHASRSLRIGSNTLVGEGVSLRDTSHAHADPSRPVRDQGDVHGTIEIEDDVWIGRGSLVLGKPEGTVLGRGCIVAAHSVVTQSIPPGEMWGGAPARFIKPVGG